MNNYLELQELEIKHYKNIRLSLFNQRTFREWSCDESFKYRWRFQRKYIYDILSGNGHEMKFEKSLILLGFEFERMIKPLPFRNDNMIFGRK